MKKLQLHHKEQSTFLLFDPEDPLYVCDFGYHKTPPRHVYGPAIRPYFLIHLIESGKGTIERNGEIISLSQGQAFIIRPNEITTYASDEQAPWTYCWISFSGTFAEKVLSQTTNQLYVPFRQSAISAIKRGLEEEKEHPMDGLNILFNVLSSIQTIREIPTETAIQTAVRFLENNYFKKIKIEELSDTLGYSRAHFTTAFTQATGKSPYAYLLEIRLEKAKEFLINKRFSIEEIAYSVGFSSLVRFSELFKKYTGVSPMQFRKRHT